MCKSLIKAEGKERNNETLKKCRKYCRYNPETLYQRDKNGWACSSFSHRGFPPQKNTQLLSQRIAKEKLKIKEDFLFYIYHEQAKIHNPVPNPSLKYKHDGNYLIVEFLNEEKKKLKKLLTNQSRDITNQFKKFKSHPKLRM